MNANADEVLRFWFGTTGGMRPEWFRKDAAFDAEIGRRFGATIEALLNGGELAGESAGASRPLLARIVVLDQFTRNAFRDTPRAFAGDPLALAEARAIVAAGDDLRLPPEHRLFIYLPFEHAEDLGMQDEALRLFSALAAESPAAADLLDYAQRHRAVIARFGRFPHRNAILSRSSTDAEIAFLKEPGSRF